MCLLRAPVVTLTVKHDVTTTRLVNVIDKLTVIIIVGAGKL